METYTLQRYQKEATTPEKAADFIRRAIAAHVSSTAYQEAQTSRSYYHGDNETIAKRQNLLYDEFGKAHVDTWTPNNKLKSLWYHNAVDQRVSYLLAAGGVTFAKPDTKKRLETPQYRLDAQVSLAAMEAYIGGESYSFMNNDHLEVFDFEHYVKIPDERDGSMSMGIRHWRLAENMPLTAYLFELDGYTVFREDGEKRLVIEPDERGKAKRPYRQTVTRSAVSEEITPGAPYPGFPIVPLSCNRRGTPLLHGIRDTLDALDIARSTSVNHVDSDFVYWLFEGYGGMDKFDIAKALADLRILHGLATQNYGESAGTRITPHTVQAPFEGLHTTIEEIKRQLNADFSVFDPQLISASGSATATEIRAAYEPLNVETNMFENLHLIPYMSRILELAEIDDTFSFKRDPVTNRQEDMQTLIMLAPYLDTEYVREAGMTILGDADRVEEVARRMDADAAARLANANATEDDDGTEGTE